MKKSNTTITTIVDFVLNTETITKQLRIIQH